VKIYVTDNFGEEFIGNSREELAENLAHTATKKYGAEVLAWFDGDHSEPLVIPENEGSDKWEVR